MASATAAPVILTPLLVSPSDIKRARREVERIDDFLHQSALRQGGKAVKLPPTSRVIVEMADSSGLNLLKKTDRDRLLKFLTILGQRAPVLHMSFASEPSASFMNKLIVWMRENIHPQVVVSIGLQPSIAAGCLVRTPNQQFDFSLRRSLEKQTESFINGLKEGMAIPETKFTEVPISTASVAPKADSAAAAAAAAAAAQAAAQPAAAESQAVAAQAATAVAAQTAQPVQTAPSKDAKADVRADEKVEAKPDAKSEMKPEAKAEKKA